MQGLRRFWIAALAVAALAVSARAQQHGQGLKLASKERLRGIPIADVPYSGTELPSRVDLSGNMPPPGQQGAQNSCVAWSVAYALKSYQEKIEERWDFGGGGQVDSRRVFSPAFIYNQLNQGSDGGASILEAFDLLSSRGAATWAAMPYSESDYLTRPNASAFEEAKRFRVNFWRQVNPADVKEVKAQLGAGYPVVFGMITDEGFQNARSGETWSSHSGKIYGGHAMILVGYDDARGAFKVMNSWGPQWCEGGYGWIAYDFFRQEANEAYIAKDAINSSPVQPPQQTPAPTPAYNPNDNPVNPPLQPTPAYVMPPQYRLNISGVWHNVIYPSAPGRYCMEIRGDLTIPPGVGYTGIVALHMYYDTTPGSGATIGYAVAATQSAYSTVDGRAACGTIQFAIPPGGTSTTWSAILPYDALNLPAAGAWHQDQFGQTFYQPAPVELIATPLLFVDNFGVAQGQWIPFYVMK